MISNFWSIIKDDKEMNNILVGEEHQQGQWQILTSPRHMPKPGRANISDTQLIIFSVSPSLFMFFKTNPFLPTICILISLILLVNMIYNLFKKTHNLCFSASKYLRQKAFRLFLSNFFNKIKPHFGQ